MEEKLIVLLFSNENFLKIIPISIFWEDLLIFSFIICVYNLGCMDTNMGIDTSMDTTPIWHGYNTNTTP